MQRKPATHTPAEPAWSAGLRRNDPAIVKAIYTEHFPAVKHYVLNNQGSIADAQDVFQEAVTVLWLRVKEGRFGTGPESDPGGFLFRVAKNKWLDVVRSAAHRNMKVVHDERLPETRVEEADDIDGRLQRLHGIYEQLDDRCRTVLDRFYFERKDLATIADELGVGEESVRTMKYRCMMKLRAFRRMIQGDQEQGEA